MDYSNENRIGFDPKLFTEDTLKKYFADKIKLVPISYKFDNKKKVKNIKYFSLAIKLQVSIYQRLINLKILKKIIQIFCMYASENVCWLLNIR